MRASNRVQVTFRVDGSTFGCELEPIGEDLYRVVDVPGVFELEYFGYRDVLRLRKAADGILELVEIAEPGRWRMFDYLVSKDFAESAELAAVLNRVLAAQGVWVRDFGGCLMILMPPDSIWDPRREMDAAIEARSRRK